MLFKRYVNCPLCFERIKVTDIGFRCEEPSCKGKDVHFRSPNEISLLEKMGLKSAPKRYPHECGNFATTRICPKCHLEIPPRVEDLSDMSIAIIGAKGVGKSHYVAMLIHWIRQMGDEFEWNLTVMNESTWNRYDNEFWRPLFVHHQTIKITQEIHTVDQAKPLIYSLAYGKGMFSRRIMLVFFDAAGENLERDGSLAYIHRYICKASGIICLLDPLQLPRVREGLAAKYGTEVLPVIQKDTGFIISRVAQLIERSTDTGAGRIKIPLAVAFSKMDFVRDADDNAAGVYDQLFQASRHRGVFCQSEFNNIDGLMRSWVKSVDVSGGILNESEGFEKSAFFGFSALGSNPKNQTLDYDPRSFRVEDPFLWLLSQKGLVKTIKG